MSDAEETARLERIVAGLAADRWGVTWGVSGIDPELRSLRSQVQAEAKALYEEVVSGPSHRGSLVPGGRATGGDVGLPDIIPINRPVRLSLIDETTVTAIAMRREGNSMLYLVIASRTDRVPPRWVTEDEVIRAYMGSVTTTSR